MKVLSLRQPWGFVLADIRALPFEPLVGSLGFFDRDRAAARQP